MILGPATISAAAPVAASPPAPPPAIPPADSSEDDELAASAPRSRRSSTPGALTAAARRPRPSFDALAAAPAAAAPAAAAPVLFSVAERATSAARLDDIATMVALRERVKGIHDRGKAACPLSSIGELRFVSNQLAETARETKAVGDLLRCRGRRG